MDKHNLNSQLLEQGKARMSLILILKGRIEILKIYTKKFNQVLLLIRFVKSSLYFVIPSQTCGGKFHL